MEDTANKGLDPAKWLVVSYCTGVDGNACSQHLDDRLPFLVRQGVTPVLLSSLAYAKSRELAHYRAPCLMPLGLRFELRCILKRSGLSRPAAKAIELACCIPMLPLFALERLFFHFECQWSWFMSAWIVGLSACRMHRPGLIYSTGGVWSVHVAAMIISKLTKTPWIAEFQDPLVGGDWPPGGLSLSRRCMRLVEGKIFRSASRVIFLTRQAMMSAAARTGVGTKGRWLYPGAKESAVTRPPGNPDGLFRFAHFGTLHGSRNLALFIRALGAVLAQRAELCGVARLDLYGSVDRLTRKEADSFPFPGVISFPGRLSRLEALAKMAASDCLLLVQNVGAVSSETIPSKFYEYMTMGRPILGLVFRNPELCRMLEERGHQVAEADDEAGMRLAIERLLAGGGVPGGREGGPGPLRAEDAVVDLVRIAREVQAEDG